MRSSLLVAILAVFCNCALQRELSLHRLSPEYREFEQFLSQHGITFYESDEYLKRLDIYQTNKRHIESRNKEGLPYTLGMNKFGHWTNEEFRNYLKTISAPINVPRTNSIETRSTAEIKDIDYRDFGVVTAVKDQGYCGSCWAFSAVGVLESQYVLATKKNITLSEQELVDCSDTKGNEGCNGGYMDWAFQYVQENGLANEKDYPYLAMDSQCMAAQYRRRIFVTDISDIQSGNETDLALALIEAGPIAVAIDAGDGDFQFYQSGIYESKECSSEYLDHGVLLVGIGSKPSDYYIVKNSWGSDWGNNGYIYMARNKNNMCGIATDASYAKIKINED